MGQYDDLKKNCQIHRENYSANALKGVSEITDYVEEQVGLVLGILNISKLKERDTMTVSVT